MKKGTTLLQLEMIDEVSIVDKGANPGARVMFTKMEESMSSLTEAVAKALVQNDGDTDNERANKALVRKQLESGKLTVEQVAAEMSIEARAREIVKRDGGSYEQAYVRAMDEDPAAASKAAGY